MGGDNHALRHCRCDCSRNRSSSRCRGRSLGSLIASAAGGIASLSAVSLLSVGGACLLQLNLFTLSISALLGIPGVIGLLLLRVIALT